MQKLLVDTTKPVQGGLHKDKQAEKTALGWMGWSVEMPEHWRPFKFEGGWTKGTVQISNGEQVTARIKWERLSRVRFSPEKWIARMLRKETGTREHDENAPVPSGFGFTGWIREHTTKTGTHGVWCGYGQKAGIVIQVLFISDDDTIINAVTEMIGSLRASVPGESFPLAVLGSKFNGPAGFRLSSWQLNLGDITVGLTSDSRQFLALRQVYPASLALSRRTLERWIKRPLYSRYRRFKPEGEVRQYETAVQGRRLKGLAVYGHKNLPSPLNRFRRLASMSAGVHDTKLDRLFLAACDMPGSLDEELMRRAFNKMDCAIKNRKTV